MANYLNLIPAPTPTRYLRLFYKHRAYFKTLIRFVGKMHKVREDKKKLDDINGSIETITEVAEGDNVKANTEDGNGSKVNPQTSNQIKD